MEVFKEFRNLVFPGCSNGGEIPEKRRVVGRSFALFARLLRPAGST